MVKCKKHAQSTVRMSPHNTVGDRLARFEIESALPLRIELSQPSLGIRVADERGGESRGWHRRDQILRLASPIDQRKAHTEYVVESKQMSESSVEARLVEVPTPDHLELAEVLRRRPTALEEPVLNRSKI